MRVEELFYKFPREVGYRRVVVNNKSELLHYVELANGVKPVYVSLYDLGLTIDKVFFDFDSTSLQHVFDEVKLFIKKLNDYNLPYIPVFSGQKGFHVYVLMKPWRPPNTETARAILRDIQVKLAGSFTTADRHVFGDVRRLVRFPNTLNKTNYCVPLPYDFTSWTIEEIIRYAKEPHTIDYNIRDIPGIEAFVDEVHDYISEDTGKLTPLHDFHDMPPRLHLIKELIRPCVFEAVTTDPEPPHIVRMALVTELMYYGWSGDSIYELIRLLNWRDFDPKITKYQIDQIFRHRYLPPSCNKLRHFVRCTNCGWVYFYRDAITS